MKQVESVAAMGLLIIGSEVLDGRREDAHFAYTRQLLAAHQLQLRYALILPDDAEVLETHIRWAMQRPEPFFCCGGIGSTPDDLTRDCAARAAGVRTAPHPEGTRLLKEKWGAGATPARLRMVEFPEGSALVPNPVNQVPGFSIRNGYFLPGFPEMARGMMTWVLEQLPLPEGRRGAGAVRLPGAREADMVDLMDAFIAAHPNVSFSSLPCFVPGGTELELGVSGFTDAVLPAFADLCDTLDAEGLSYRVSRRP